MHSANMEKVRVSIVFESGARIGPGKAKLLEGIRDTGSISAAAREMGSLTSARGSCSTA
jgi:molybdate transport system regulatory protein